MAEADVIEFGFHYDFDGVELSRDRVREAEGIIETFKQELLQDSREAIVEFHFRCNPDRIEWDDQAFSHMEFVPSVTVALDFEELGGGRFNSVTPEGIAGLLFRGRNRRQFNEELLAALVLERDRAARGHDSELHVDKIQKHMNKARGAILTSFRAATANWK